MFSDDLARPTFQPFVVEAIYTWIECDLKKYPGFRLEVRMNLKNRERRALNDLVTDITERGNRIAENFATELDAITAEQTDLEAQRDTALEAGDTDTLSAIAQAIVALSERRADLVVRSNAAHEENAARIHERIAPYIRDWNLATYDTDTGETEAIPPPMVAGVEAFEDLDQTLINWIVSALMGAYKGGKGLNGSSLTLDGPDAPPSASNETTPSDAPKTDPSETPHPSPENSRSRSRSRSKNSDRGSTGNAMPLSTT